MTKIPLCIPRLDGNEARYLQECVSTGFVSSVGPFVERFEKLVAESAGVARAVATASGTSALHLALIGAGVGRDDLVIVPAFTFIGTANAVAHAGAQPWIVDVAERDWNLDPVLLRTVLREETRREGARLVHLATGRRVAAIVAVYAMGEPAEMDALGEIARAFGLPLVADAAGAAGAEYRGQPLGPWADFTVFSFNGNKTVTAGGGGAIVGPDPARLAALKHVSTQARVGTEYHHDRVGYNYRMTNLQAAVGCAQMERLAEFVALKRAIRDRYDRALARTPGLKAFPRAAKGRGSGWYSGVSLDEHLPMGTKAFCEELGRLGVEARGFWKPIDQQPPYASAPASLTGVTDRFWRRIVTLPCSSSLTSEDQARVIEAVRQVAGACAASSSAAS
ncbi:MAG: DegT/DnrJ/EryC1/StrS family aminotransferase [Planctomycetota bacterium]|nr:DegT/DnrJ/EryC1/StrS family aminotransferase [Planctomycetota bacterium]